MAAPALLANAASFSVRSGTWSGWCAFGATARRQGDGGSALDHVDDLSCDTAKTGVDHPSAASLLADAFGGASCW
jgi:hypothetical protein